MARKTGPGHFLREWRLHAGFKSIQAACDRALEIAADKLVTEEELGESRIVGLSQPNLSRIERGEVPYNQTLLELLAEVYGTDPASLIMRNPEDPEGIWSVYDQIPVSERPVALKILRGLKTGTDG